jgi:hypothetical protein
LQITNSTGHHTVCLLHPPFPNIPILIHATRCPKNQLQDPRRNSTRRIPAASRAHCSASSEPTQRSPVLYLLCPGYNYRQWIRNTWTSCSFPWRVQGH